MSWSSNSEWEQLPDDPDLEDDLGYRTTEWEIVRPSNGSGHYIFLPEDEEMLRRDAFIVADEESVCDVESKR